MILETVLLTSLYFQCGEGVHPDTLHTIAKTESALNPYVIANVTDEESYYLNSKEEAISKANDLKEAGKRYSAGLMQIYSLNFEAYDLNNSNVFDYCTNISAGAQILKKCYLKASSEYPDERSDFNLDNAMSCYYSGNFSRGFKKDEGINSSYVERIRNNVTNIYEVPSFYNYLGSDFKKGSNQEINITKKEGFEEVVLFNDNWDVFNDYEIEK